MCRTNVRTSSCRSKNSQTERSAQRLEDGGKVAQGRGLVDDAVAPQVSRVLCDVLADLDDVVDVALRVRPPRDGQPRQVEGGRHLRAVRLAAEHHRADLDAAHPPASY